MNDVFFELENYKKREELTQRGLCKELGVPEEYYCRWRNNGVKGIYAEIIKLFLKRKEREVVNEKND